MTGKEWTKFTCSWFVFNALASDLKEEKMLNHETEEHPATYSPTMVSEFIKYFTKEGDTVIDPFAGIGSTLVACVSRGRLAGDGSGGEHVEAFHVSGSGSVVSFAESCNRNHRAVGTPYEEEAEIVAVGSVWSLCLNVDAVDAVEHIEVVDIQRARKSLHGRKDIRHRHTLQTGFVAVDIVV